MKNFILLFVSFLLGGCSDIPTGVKPMEGFEANRYLGTWHEIARLDHSFERGMEQITATYSMKEDGGVKVLNRGFITAKGKFSQAEGKAYFVDGTTKGFLKVSFFGPFYGSYIVIETDYENYTMISGPDHSYFWILSRKPSLDTVTLERLKTKAKQLGFDTDKLIYPKS